MASTLIKAGQRDHISGVVALAPVAVHPDNVPVGFKDIFTSYKENGSGVPIIDAATMRTFFDAVDCKPNDELTFVTLADSTVLKEFPRTYIATCGKDPLRDDGVVLERMLQRQSVDVVRKHYEGLPHYFWILPLEKSKVFLEDVTEGVKYVLKS